MLIHNGRKDCYEDCLPSNWLHKTNRPIQKPFISRLEKQNFFYFTKTASNHPKTTIYYKNYYERKDNFVCFAYHSCTYTFINPLSFYKNVIADLGPKSIL